MKNPKIINVEVPTHNLHTILNNYQGVAATPYTVMTLHAEVDALLRANLRYEEIDYVWVDEYIPIPKNFKTAYVFVTGERPERDGKFEIKWDAETRTYNLYLWPIRHIACSFSICN